MAQAVVTLISVLFCLAWLDTLAKQKSQKHAGTLVETTINIFSRCSAVGLHNINIIWKPHAGLIMSSLYMYKIFFCNPYRGKSCGSVIHQGPYQLGCVLNVTSPSTQEELQCNIGPTLAFHFPQESSFYFIVEATNSSGVYTSTRKTCRLAMNMKCTTPHNFNVSALGSRNLTLSWISPPFMGQTTPYLCYRILYSVAGGSNKSVSVDASEGSLSMTIRDLHSYTNYTFFIQCSLPGCIGWGHLAGPVSALTGEEAPSEPPVFENWSAVAVSRDKRNVMVIWQPPPRESWNGIPRKFEIDLWEMSATEPESVEPNSQLRVRIDDGFATEGALVGLHRFTNYMARVSMCNSQGCGPRSFPLHVQAERKTTQITRPDNSQRLSSTVPGYVWSILIIVLVTVLSCIVYACWKRRIHRNNQQPLERRIHLERPQEHLEWTSPTTDSNTYDELELHVGDTGLSPHRRTPDHLERNSNDGS